MRIRPGHRGGCLTAFLVTVGVLTLVLIVACGACVFFLVRQQRDYRTPEQVREFAARLCDLSLLEGCEPVEAVQANLFLVRLEFAQFVRPTEQTGPVRLNVGRLKAWSRIVRRNRQARAIVEDRSDRKTPPAMELVESYTVQRVVEGEEVEFIISLYRAARGRTSESAPRIITTSSGAGGEPTSGEAGREGEEKPSAPESDKGASEGAGRAGEQEGATEPQGAGANRVGGQASARGGEKPLISPDKEGNWLVVVGVRSRGNVARFVRFAGPRSEWDEAFFIKLLMSIR